MSRPKSPEGKPGSKSASLNSLIVQLEDPRSLLSFLPELTKQAALKIPDEYLSKDETELLQFLMVRHSWQPSVQMESLRRNFWMEYDRIQMSKVEKEMVLENVYGAVFTRTRWYYILKDEPHILAFILCRPQEYEASMLALQNHANRKFYEVLSLPIRNAKDEIDVKLLELQLKAAAMIDLRNKGGYLNRSETKNLTMLSQKTEHSYAHTVTMNLGSKTAAQAELTVRQKLKELEEEARTQLPPPEPKFEEATVADAEYTDVKKRDK